MSINLQNDGIGAITELRANPHFAAFRAALERTFILKMHTALDCAEPANRGDAVGYARALRDLHIAIESAATGVPHVQVKKPGSEKSSAAR